ncbi:MAG: amidohydrolase family protein [Planctomycetales bacterium]|nr:amidohydrolase family protein [Planctomycetales bacterium]
MLIPIPFKMLRHRDNTHLSSSRLGAVRLAGGRQVGNCLVAGDQCGVSDCLRIQAQFIVASPWEVYHPGQIVIRNEKLVEVCASTSSRPDIDLPHSVLLPALVNPHTHLEFSDLDQPIAAGRSFPEWISAVVKHRRENQSSNSDLASARAKSVIAKGLQQANETGTAVLGDIVSMPWQPNLLSQRTAEETLASSQTATERRLINDCHRHFPANTGTRVVAFPEVIGLDAARLNAVCDWAESLLSGHSQINADISSLVAIGVSPHAPYSLLWPTVAEFINRIPVHIPTAMHVAESEDELQWLRSGSGPFREAFERLDLPVKPDCRNCPTIEQCIGMLSRRKHGLLIHGNYLTNGQIQQLAQSPSISVVYCPRTHAHFGHHRYPLPSLQAASVRVVLGTDSRASSPDLNLWLEVVQARERHAELSPQQALAMVTCDAARALGVDRDYGQLRAGLFAAVATVASQPHWNTLNLLEEMTLTPLAVRPLAAAIDQSR